MVALDSHPEVNLQTLTGASPNGAYGLPKAPGIPQSIKNIFKSKHHDTQQTAAADMEARQHRVEAEQSARRMSKQLIAEGKI